MSDLRMLVREILAAEIAKVKQDGYTPWQREEIVSLSTNSELDAFVKRIILMLKDSALKKDIETGRYIFKLAQHGAKPVQAYRPSAPSLGQIPPVRLEGGLITEKEIQKLPENLKSLSVGKTAKFTPLANDEIRRRNIKVERTKL